MQVCDYSRSVLTFRIDMRKKPPVTVSRKPPFTVNNARLQLDSLCRITSPTGQSHEFVLSASCKGEQVNVDRDMWQNPAADMCMVAGDEEFMVIKSWDRCDKGVKLHPPSLGDQPERQVCRIADALDRLCIHRHIVEGRTLGAIEEIVEAGLANRPLVGQTEFSADDGSRVLVEYPIKTINVSERDHFYQIDTGPILWPELSGNGSHQPIAALQRAFIAHNRRDYAEVIINVPTPIADGISVNHYSKIVQVEVVNRLIEIP